MLRTSLLPGPAEGDRLQRVAPQPRRRRCSRSATSSGARDPGAAAARRARDARRRARRRVRRRPHVAVVGWRSRRRSAGDDRAGGRGGPARPAPDPHRCVLVEGEALGAVGEVDPAVLAATASTSGSRGSRSTSAPARPAARRAPVPPVSRFPSSDIDLAFVVADAVPAGDVERTLREPRASCSSTSAVRRLPRRRPSARGAQPGLRAAPPGRRPHPHRRRGRRGAPRSASRQSRQRTAPSSAAEPDFVRLRVRQFGAGSRLPL